MGKQCWSQAVLGSWGHSVLQTPALVPSSVNEVSCYNLRNANDVQTINARTALYFIATVSYTKMEQYTRQ